MEVVAATGNKKKLEELRRMLGGSGIEISSLDGYPGHPKVRETGLTFEENAVLKARAIAAYTGRAALADDSGLEVYALRGAPGVRSARYAGYGAIDQDNLQKLLHDMQDVPEGQRGGRFLCVLALCLPGEPCPKEIFEGEIKGTIAREPKGAFGFGYDPVFLPEGCDRTFAEMAPKEKDSMSHRGRALRKLQQYFSQPGGLP